MSQIKTIYEPAREIPVVEADVFIAGAGTAGCIAALAAARAGAKVVLVEKLPVPGGTFTNGGNSASSFYAQTMDPDDAKRIVGGIPYELMQRLDEQGNCSGFVKAKKVTPMRQPYTFKANPEIYKGVISEMLMEAGVKVYLQTMFCGVRMDGGRITAAFIENKDGRSAIVAKQYVDASGDGDIAKFAGVEQQEDWQDYTSVCGGPTGLVFGIAGIDYDKAVRENGKAVIPSNADMDTTEGRASLRSFMFVHGQDPERYKPLMDLDLNFFTSFQFLYPGHAAFINNSRGVVTDASKAENLSSAEMECRIKIMKMAKALRECVPGFENSYMAWASTQLGIRISKITMCDKMLTQKEISDSARFDDEIGLYGFHDLAPKREYCFSAEKGFYGFPYRMLLAKGCDNLYMAGRCVTLDIEAHMSTRNVVGCQIMGQGAGVAAALCAKRGCGSRELPYSELRQELLKQDVILDA